MALRKEPECSRILVVFKYYLNEYITQILTKKIHNCFSIIQFNFLGISPDLIIPIWFHEH